jgi:hypothetical protein
MNILLTNSAGLVRDSKSGQHYLQLIFSEESVPHLGDDIHYFDPIPEHVALHMSKVLKLKIEDMNLNMHLSQILPKT